MPELQEPQRPEAIPEPSKTRLSAREDKRRVQRKKLADKAATVIITFGGIAIILSIVAILFVIVAETLPLWQPPTAELRDTIELGQALNGRLSSTPALGALSSASKPLVVGVDEYQRIAYLVTDAGTVDFLSLSD